MRKPCRVVKALSIAAALSINSLGTFTTNAADVEGEVANDANLSTTATSDSNDTPVADNGGTSSSQAYGYDISWPMLKLNVSTNYPGSSSSTTDESAAEDAPIQPLGNRQQFYEDYIQGCRDYWSATEERRHDMKEYGESCDEFERQRLAHNIDQPSSMVNFTDVGYKKIKAPTEVYSLLVDFWNKNYPNEELDEEWIPGNTFINYWESQTKMVDAQDRSIDGGGELMEKLWRTSVDTISEWTGQNLVPSSIYGIRVYKEGSVLSSHVDRLPLVCSAIINVAQDVEEPWPLEVIGHDGIARNVTMEPGEMVLYESHSIIHGRPFPLKGKYFANIFIHFEPDPDEAYESDLPNYILDGTIEAKRYREGYYEGEIPSQNAYWFKDSEKSPWGAQESHDAAGDGNLAILKRIAEENKELLHTPDDNGWHPIHEAARGGHKEIVELLIEHGADVNERTHHGKGFSVLTILEQHWGEEHPLFDYLISVGAFTIGPEL